ncbi:MAG: phage portal protein, partial [Lachnospiraceae bacterium]|nr:phage portal protein [Lachnospiraceae bacterium]
MRKKRDSTQAVKSPIAVWLADGDLSCAGYVSLDQNPEILTACRRISQLIGATTIYLMNNTADGDKRIVNELSRAVDIEPMPTMTRSTWMESIIMTLLLYGRGNAVVVPHTWKGLLQNLEPIAADRVSFSP